jgi:glycosyltransferase involved in cell wall biosynthesis
VLLYFGDGPFMPQLAAIRERLDSKEHIIFAGFRADADTLTAGADLCVVPSTWAEAFGLAALEPMAHGIPVIASNAGGLPEVVVDGETGLLVPPGDEAALEAALRRLLDDPAERIRMGENGRRRAATYFTRESQLGRLVAILRRGFDGPGETADDGPGRRGGKIPARPAAEFEPVRTTASRPPS